MSIVADVMCLDILIPVYNEADNIVDVLDAVRRYVKTPFRVLICYDHEDDNTLGALARYDHPSFEIELVKNPGRGIHSAVVAGFRASSAPAVLIFPADDVHNTGIIDTLVERFQRGDKVVAPSRFMKGGQMQGCPWLKAILVRCAAFTLYHFAIVPTHDATNGFRLFSREILDTVEIESSLGGSYSIELLVKCHRLGWPISEVPAVWFERSKGQSRFRVFRWVPAYLRWYLYAFMTTYVRLGADTVRVRRQVAESVAAGLPESVP